MTIRTISIVFAAIFSIGIFAIIILPFVFGVGPSLPRAGTRVEKPGEVAAGLFRSDDGGMNWQSKSWVEGSNTTIAGFRSDKPGRRFAADRAL